MLFGEVSEENAHCMKEILDSFCQFSGHKMNAHKSKVSFSANMKPQDCDMIRATLGFQVEEDLGAYLGVPLLHKRTIMRTFQFVVDKVQKILNGFKGKLFSLAGRITLVKSVLLAIPSYFMQSMMIPIGVCETIEKIVRQLA